MKKKSLEPVFSPADSERFWASVKKADGCWEWQGQRKRGYGQFYIDGGRWNAHRLSVTISTGPIPRGLRVCHRCDNPGCVRPVHLFIGTQRDNLIDALRKGRSRAPSNGGKVALGENTRSAKLIASDVREIRAMSAAGWSGNEIASEMCVSKSIVSDVLTGKTWRHVK